MSSLCRARKDRIGGGCVGCMRGTSSKAVVGDMTSVHITSTHAKFVSVLGVHYTRTFLRVCAKLLY